MLVGLWLVGLGVDGPLEIWGSLFRFTWPLGLLGTSLEAFLETPWRPPAGLLVFDVELISFE